jgi:hypothetical protein
MRAAFFAVAAAAALAFAAPSSAADLVFMLDNQSSEAVTEFYVSSVAEETWGDDILGLDVLPSGEAARITITGAGEDECAFDMRYVYEGGSVVEEREIDLCETGSYTVTD